MNTFYKTLLLVSLIFFSCKEKSTDKNQNDSAITDQNNVSVLHLENLQKVGKIELKNFFGTLEAVLLENNGVSQISRINKIFFNDTSIIIIDKNLSSVFVFKRDGTFDYKVNNIGRGPGEYLYITDATYNYDQKQIVVYDRDLSKIVIFDAINGSYVQEYKADARGESIEYIESNYFAFFINNFSLKYKSEDGFYNIAILDSAFQPVNLDYSIPDDQFHFKNGSWSHFSRGTDSTLLFNYLNDYNIYEISKDSLTIKYQIDAGGNSTDFESLFEGKPMPEEISTRLSRINTVRNITTFIETDQYFSFHFRDTELRNVLIDKGANKGIIYNGFVDSFGNHTVYPRVFGMHENQIILAGKSISLNKAYNIYKDCCIVDKNIIFINSDLSNPVLFIGKVDLEF